MESEKLKKLVESINIREYRLVSHLILLGSIVGRDESSSGPSLPIDILEKYSNAHGDIFKDIWKTNLEVWTLPGSVTSEIFANEDFSVEGLVNSACDGIDYLHSLCNDSIGDAEKVQDFANFYHGLREVFLHSLGRGSEREELADFKNTILDLLTPPVTMKVLEDS